MLGNGSFCAVVYIIFGLYNLKFLSICTLWFRLDAYTVRNPSLVHLGLSVEDATCGCLGWGIHHLHRSTSNLQYILDSKEQRVFPPFSKGLSQFPYTAPTAGLCCARGLWMSLDSGEWVSLAPVLTSHASTRHKCDESDVTGRYIYVICVMNKKHLLMRTSW